MRRTAGKSTEALRLTRLLKNCARGRHSALRGSRQCSHMLEYAALVASPRALPDGLILVFQHPVTILSRGYFMFFHPGPPACMSRQRRPLNFLAKVKENCHMTV